MSSYAGRHRTSALAPSARLSASTRTLTRPVARPWVGSSMTTRLRRPALAAGVAVAVVGVGAAGLAWAGDNDGKSVAVGTGGSMATVAFTSPAVTAQEHKDLKVQANAARAAAGVVAGAKQETARQELAARQVEAERASREAQRQAVLANAQANPKAVAQQLLGDFGWSASQFSCLDSLWTKESNWRYTATNGSSGAYGIPQSLPGSKMATVAADWRTNPVTQITWGLKYIKGSYGSPCSAWSHSQATNWY